jgi:hypothetical protein
VTWTTVNATPNDPVQSMTGVWQQGGSHQDRNLLDFNEITIDDKGRVLYGYSDGCVTEGCIAGTAANDFVAFMRVARQSGGKSLFASNDVNVNEPAAPKPPCLSGTRDPSASHLSWKAPDNRGSDIVSYQIFRGTSSGGETLLGQTDKTSFDDTTANPAVAHYYYTVKATNAIGTGNASNEIDLTVVAPPPPENVCAAAGSEKTNGSLGRHQRYTNQSGAYSGTTRSGPSLLPDLAAVCRRWGHQVNLHHQYRQRRVATAQRLILVCLDEDT